MGADAQDAGDDDPEWYAQQAVDLGYISAAQAAVLVGNDADAAADVMRTIWDFSTDPAFAADRAREAQRAAIADRLLSPEERTVLASRDLDAGKVIWRRLSEDPEYSALSGIIGPDWSLDWPAGTPAEQIGPGRRRTQSGS